jgi:hypothetical protein
MDNRIENIKRLGVKVERIVDNPTESKIFLICPVRNATPEQRKWIEKYVEDQKEDGYIIHAPHLHTRQVDLFGGYSICKQNAQAIAHLLKWIFIMTRKVLVVSLIWELPMLYINR